MPEVIDSSLRIGAVTLAVSDLPASAGFYERVLGLELLALDERRALLAVPGSAPALELLAIERPVSAAPGATGLFHVAWLHPTRAVLAETVKRIAAAGWPLGGAADHGVSEALYLADPDGLGIEIYADRPRESWRRRADGEGVEMVTLALDVEDLLAQWPGEPRPRLTAGTSVGHVHLKVADVERAARFYERLGFQQQARVPSAAFVSAGGYHHHLGLNSWRSSGGVRPPDDAPGLRNVTFELDGGETPLRALAAAAGDDARRERGSVSLRDPDGELVTFTGQRAG